MRKRRSASLMCVEGRERCRRAGDSAPSGESGSIWPERHLSSVVLPEPDSPTIASTSPGQRSKRHRAADARRRLARPRPPTALLVAILPQALLSTGRRRSPCRPRALARNNPCRSRRTCARPRSSMTISSRKLWREPHSAQGSSQLCSVEGMVLEIEAAHARIGRDRIDALLAARAEQLQRRTIVEFRIVEFRDRARDRTHSGPFTIAG